ncbi:MAG: sulfatase-like hydrolase/transferase [Actinomycetota bacterium]|nr:sulfatase-like hydrolase/transferase [Actinomycetota bacterium]
MGDYAEYTVQERKPAQKRMATQTLPKAQLVTTGSEPYHAPESTAPAWLWVLPLVGAILTPGLWWTTADWPFAFRPDLIGTMTLFVGIAATTVLAVLSSGFRWRIRWSLGVTTAVVIAGFQWRMFTIAGESVAEATGISLIADVIPILLAGALLWLTVRLAQDWQFALITGVAMMVAVTWMALANIALVAPAPGPLSIEHAEPGSPDVVLVVLDGYARADWLEDEYGFDNRSFLEGLESRGFAIASAATPNYGYTYASVSTMLNLDYVFTTGEVSDDERHKMRAALTGATGLIPLFKEAGYEITYLENAWGGSQCGSVVDWCVRDGLTERSLWNLGQMTILAPILRTIRPDPFNSVSEAQLESLGGVLAAPHEEGKPRFTFAHVLMPHTPLLLDAECNRHGQDELRRWGAEEGELLAARRLNYVEQTRCVNSKVLDAIDSLLSANPDALVMITGDHGPGSTLDVNLPLDQLPEATIQERMKTLGAYRLPGCSSSVRKSLTPVNGTRILTNCALGTNLAPLSDLNRWADLDGEGYVTDITSRLIN